MPTSIDHQGRMLAHQQEQEIISAMPTPELYRIAGIWNCERILFSRPPEVEAEIDRRIAALESEIARRAARDNAGVTQEAGS